MHSFVHFVLKKDNIYGVCFVSSFQNELRKSWVSVWNNTGICITQCSQKATKASRIMLVASSVCVSIILKNNTSPDKPLCIFNLWIANPGLIQWMSIRNYLVMVFSRAFSFAKWRNTVNILITNLRNVGVLGWFVSTPMLLIICVTMTKHDHIP